MPTQETNSLLQQTQRALVSLGFRTLFEGLAQVGRLNPGMRRTLQRVDVTPNLSYVDDTAPWHQLDVYRPKGMTHVEQRPALLYLHGGAFQILSKQTHWAIAAAFANAGYVVFNANYRLAPKAKYPCALEDAVAAYSWVVKNAARFGGDVSRLVVAGESAGANLSLALAVAACFRRDEPYARQVFDIGLVPALVIPMCGILQVSHSERFLARKPNMPRIVAARIREMERAYLSNSDPVASSLADPLCILESEQSPARPLPPMFSAVGTKDPILDDTRRLERVLKARGVKHRVRIYPGELHAFHALLWRAAAKDCWQQQFAFMTEVLSEPSNNDRRAI